MRKALDDDHVGTLTAEHVEPASPDAPRRMTLNMGPQHPSTHGVLRIMLELEGETIRKAVPDIGFLHTGIEKQCEALTWQQVVPLTDRVDYLANLSNNLVYALAVEKLLQIEIPPRAQWMRVMMTELSRLNSHLVWLGTHALDIGAMSMFFYCFREREDILRIFEMFSGPAHDDQLHPHRRIGSGTAARVAERGRQIHSRLSAAKSTSTKSCSIRIRSGRSAPKASDSFRSKTCWIWA